MSTEIHKDLVRRFYDEALNGHRVDVIDELALADYVEHEPLPGQRDGLMGLKDRASMLIEGLASTYSLHDIIADIAKHEGDLNPRRLNIFQQRRGKRAISSVPVESGSAVASGIRDQHVPDRLNTAEAAADRRA